MASVPLCVRICLAVVWRRGHDQASQTMILVASGLSWPPPRKRAAEREVHESCKTKQQWAQRSRTLAPTVYDCLQD